MPRNITGPLVRHGDLFGRARELATAWRLLEHGSVLLAAPRRYGKSSLMSALADAPRDGWTVVLVDVEYVESPAELVTELTAAVLQHQRTGQWFRSAKKATGSLGAWVRAVVDEVGVGLPMLGEARLKLRDAIDTDHWKELAEQLLATLAQVDGRVLLILDEFPTLLSTLLERDRAAAIGFLRWFRAQRQRSTARFLVGGSVNIEPVLEDLGEIALINDLERLRLDPFPRDVAIRFVTEVLAHERVAHAPGVPEAIVDAVGTGVPFFLQVLISELALEPERLRVEDVERAYRDRVLGPVNKARFSHYATRLRGYGPDEHAARLALAAVSSGPLATAELLARLGGVHEHPARVLVRLEGDYYLVRDGERWDFHSRLLRDWWLRNAPLPDVP